MKFDLVSDLHIDFWGEQFHTDWLKDQHCDTLVVAGDVSDNVEMTCEFVDTVLCNAYGRVLIVDGNHEHQPQFPNLEDSIRNWEICIAQTSANYLGFGAVDIDGVRFIGINGWWSFDFGEPNIAEHTSRNALINRTSWGEDTYLKQKAQGLHDAVFLKEQMADAQKQDCPVVVVTHSLPHPSCISWNVYPENNHFVGLYGNTNYEWTFEKDTRNLMKYWLFGHNHDHKNIPYGDASLISNPRGRPKDWNREQYSPLQLEV
jgi:predicted phosphodiesterase